MITGSELVRGDRRDANGPYLAQSLLSLGIEPAQIRIVGDEPEELERALRDALAGYDLVVVSGGLGPTHDDRTVELLARAAGVGLQVDEDLRDRIEDISRRVAERLNRPYADFEEGVRKQALLPEGGFAVDLVGTAPALVLVHTSTNSVAVVLPGPPRELQALWPKVLETEVTKHGKGPGESLRRRQGASLNVDDPRVRHGPSDVRQGPMKREMNL